MSLPLTDKEISVIAEVSVLPGKMQLIYLQLVSAMEASIADLETEGASSEHIRMEFVEALINRLQDRSMSRQRLTNLVKNEIRRQLERAIATG